MPHRLVLAAAQIMMLASTVVSAASAKHPNLLLNRDEIEQVKAKIAKYPWAAAALEKTKDRALKDSSYLDAALYYAFTGDKNFADQARGYLLGHVDEQTFSAWGISWGAVGWTYDLVYDTCSETERVQIERWLKTACTALIDEDRHSTTTPNLIFGKHLNVALVGYCLGDKEVIDWGLNDSGQPFGSHKGGFYPVMDTMIRDGHFWAEAPIYALVYDVHSMLALAEAARHYDGTDLYHWVSKKSGASIKSVIDGYLLTGYPVERTGIGQGRIRMATFGDGSTSFDPSGVGYEDPPEGLTTNLFLTVMEIASARYKDPGYAWVLSLPPDRNTDGSDGRAPWGLVALSHGEPLPDKPTPPAAPSGVYPSQGFAILRADESPAYWTSGALAAMVRTGEAVGHGHKDYYELVLHGKGRLLYPDVNVIQYEADYLNWTHEGIAHSTLLVDHQSPEAGQAATLQDFNPDVKFFAVTGSAFRGVTQTRRLVLTKDYLVDVFHAHDDQGASHTFDWVLHGLGRLHPGNPTAYRSTDALLPHYWWIDDERSRTTDDTWRADWIQRSAGLIEGAVPPPGTQGAAVLYGKEWFDTEVGTRLTMLGTKGTVVYYGDGPITHAPPFGRMDGQPEPGVPLVLARRTGQAATFTAVHEPYTGAPKLRRVERIAETDSAVITAVETPNYTDYLCVAFDDKPHTLTTGDGQAFSFSEYGYLHAGKAQPLLRGKLTAFRVKADAVVGDSVAVEGKPAALHRKRGFCTYGSLPEQTAATPVAPGVQSAAEEAPALHYWLLPDEVHLSALKDADAREITLHLRCVGPGQVAGRLRIAAPAGLKVEPAVVEVPPLGEGPERTVKLTVSKAAKMERDLYPVTIRPEGNLRAATTTLMVSVGVVITKDVRRPLSAQYVVRAPGYTTKVDLYSGVSFYLLDADGHRRFGRFYGNFTYGFPGLEGVVQYRNPCEFIWPGKDDMTVSSNGVRLNYSFKEDQIVYRVIQPSDPAKKWTTWLGTFDIIDDPIHRTKPSAADGAGGGEWYFLPHPVFRQGLLVTLPPQTELTYPKGYGYGVSFPIRPSQDIVLQFMAKAEWEAGR